MSQAGIASSVNPSSITETLTGNSGGAVPPDAGNNINVIGDGTTINVVGDPGSNTLTISTVGGGSGITTIDGDVSSVTGSTVILTSGLSTLQSGASVLFTGNGTTTMSFSVTDVDNNTLIGLVCGNSTLSGLANTGLGAGSLHTLTSGTDNVAIGAEALNALTTGSHNVSIGTESHILLSTGDYNTSIGTGAGNSYITNESNNIIIKAGFNPVDLIGDSNTIRIGNNTDQTSCYIAGILGVTTGSPSGVTIDTVTGQLGVAAGGSGITLNGDTGSCSGTSLNIVAGIHSGASVSFVGDSLSSIIFLDTDTNSNVFIGQGSGTNSTGITNVTALGAAAASNLQGGQGHVSIGVQTLMGGGFGSFNTVVGYGAGATYTTSESNNIVIAAGGTDPSVNGESNTIHIGGTDQTSCFIAGIAGVTVSSSAAVLINTSTGQLGTVPSSERYKENIEPMGNTSVLDLEPVTFSYRSDPSKAIQYGLIAEQVH